MADIYGLDTDPLDVSSLMQQVAPAAAPAQSPSPQKPGWKQMAMLAALIPVAAKRGGRVGISALLEGMQQAQAQRNQSAQQQFQNNRLTQQDQRLAGQEQATEAYRRQTLENQQRTQRLNFLKQFQDSLGNVEDPNQVAGLLDAYGLAGNELGVQRGALDRMAMQMVTPSSLEKKAAEKHLKALKTQYGDKWLETGQQFAYTMPYGKKATLQELLAMQGQDTGGAPIKTPEPVEKPETRSIAVQAADALRRGDTAEYQRLVKVQHDIGQADDRPQAGPDPVLEEIRRIRLEQLKQGQQASPLPPQVQKRVDALGASFRNEGMVKQTQTQAAGVSFAQSISDNTNSPADDIAMIYAFAKVMDPNSVVREGEYATVQKYAQSWAQSFGFSAARIFSNSKFLSADAIRNMKAAMKKKYQADRRQYDNLTKQYARQINQATGLGDGQSRLIDYAEGFPVDEPAPKGGAPAPVTVTPPARAGGAGPVAPGANPFRVPR